MTPKLIRKKATYNILLLTAVLICTAMIYLGTTVSRSWPLYDYVKNNERGWKGKVFQSDPLLGFKAVPFSSGYEIMPSGKHIPVSFDEEGFRVSSSNPINSDTPRKILFLGDSFTYGAAVATEKTFTHLSGHKLGANVINAGIPSYGVAHMVLQAPQLLEKHKPDYLIVQYSPWLIERAISYFLPSYIGFVPGPYYSEQPELHIAPPIFTMKLDHLPVDKYRDTPRSLTERLKFILEVGLPLFWHDDKSILTIFARGQIAQITTPTKNISLVTRHAYHQLQQLAREHGSTFLILVLGSDMPMQIPHNWLPPAPLINAQFQLLQRLPTSDQSTYQKTYMHWYGTPPRMIDNHPNELAHSIIAEEIVRVIEQLEANREAEL